MKKVLFFVLTIFTMCACSFGIHEHTFSDEYSYDKDYHWFASTCSHDVISQKSRHEFGAGVVDDSDGGLSTIYTCKVCGYTTRVEGADLDENDNEDNIKKAEEIIANTYDSCSRENMIVKAQKRRTTNSSLRNLIQESSGLTGSFHYEESNVEGFLKGSSEPLSFAFGLLEYFAQNGLPENDFSRKLYFNPYSHVVGINTEMSYIRIKLLSDDILTIDYGSYHMILGKDEDITFVMSYGYSYDKSNDYMDTLTFEYFSNGPSLIYMNASLNWKDEIDLAIEYFKNAEDFSVLPLEIMKEMYLVNGEEKPIDYHYDEKNPNHVVLPTYYRYSFTSPSIIQEYFMYVHYHAKVSNPWMSAIVEEGVLKYVDGSGMVMFEIPEEVKVIDNLANRDEDTPYKTTFFGLFFHNTDVEFGKEAFDRTERICAVFIDSLERNETFENAIREHFPDVKFYYQDEWEIKCELILPKVEIEEDDSDHEHIFTRQIESEEYFAQEANCMHGTCYYYVCELCDKHSNQFYEVGEKGEHNYVENQQYGNEVWYICTNCGLQYGHNITDTEHHFVLIEAVPATCTEDGYYLYRCKITGEEKIETQEKFHHCFSSNGICIRCFTEKITYEEHDFCFKNTDEVSINMYCKICGDKYFQYWDFSGHIFENGVCKECVIEEHEHKYGETFVINDVNYHCCNICGFIEQISKDE